MQGRGKALNPESSVCVCVCNCADVSLLAILSRRHCDKPLMKAKSGLIGQ